MLLLILVGRVSSFANLVAITHQPNKRVSRYNLGYKLKNTIYIVLSCRIGMKTTLESCSESVIQSGFHETCDMVMIIGSSSEVIDFLADLMPVSDQSECVATNIYT